MYLTIIFLPLISSILTGIFGRFLGFKIGIHLATLLIGITSILSIYVCNETLQGINTSIELFSWFNSGDLQIHWGFYFDQVTAFMIVIVSFISALVHLYSIGYMEGDPHQLRFFSYLSIFTFFMLVLVTADNYLQMLVGWEGVGISSYLLINFWYTRNQANKSAIKAFLMNRVGDFGLILGLIVMFKVFKSLDYSIVFSLAPYFKDETIIFLGLELNSITVICLLLFLGAVGKSAQLGLHMWLPQAMEGPSPVSALIHAATMVTAGVFLMIRSSPLIEYSTLALSIITIVGALTAFFAGTVALVQNDVKRVIAYSTCSQLGYMFVACGLSQYALAFYHLFNHAFFKALLFLSAGCLIHSMNDQQDLRRYGGLRQLLPLTYSAMMIGSLSLMGIPFLTGFYSKDLIVEVASSSYTNSGIFAYILITLSVFLTSFYSIRLIMLTFIQKPNGGKKAYETVHESNWYLITPVIILSICSILIGYLFRDIFVGFGTNYWGNSIYQASNGNTILMIDSEFSTTWVKLLPFFLSSTGALLAWIIYTNKLSTGNKLRELINYPKPKYIYHFLSQSWFFDPISNYLIVNPILKIGYHSTFLMLDKGIFDITGPSLLGTISNKTSTYLKNKYHTGYLYDYVSSILIGIIISIISIFIIIT